MKNWIIGFAGILLVACSARSGASNVDASLPTTPTSMTPTPFLSTRTSDKLVSAGRVVPVLRSALNMPIAGVVAKVLVSEGDSVPAGQTILSLDNSLQGTALAQAQANLRRAQAALDQTKAMTMSLQTAQAQAGVDAAQAAVDQAGAALGQTELKAPFAGTVASLNVRVGEQVTPGAPVAQLADLTAWQIETTDVTELTVGSIKVGDKATMTFSAIPGLELTGRVVKIKPLGEIKQGDTVYYTVTVWPDKLDDRLRWNMTASVTIETGN